MRFWDPADPAIAAADAEPWDGPLSGAMRPVSIRVLTRLYVAGTALAVQSGIAAFVMSYVAEERSRTRWCSGSWGCFFSV